MNLAQVTPYNYNYSYTYDVSNSGPALVAFSFIYFIVIIAIYVYYALCLQNIAKKTNTENGWFAWIPILNVILMLQIAKKPVWWIVLMLIPFVNIVIMILVWMAIAEQAGKENWWGILIALVPVVNFILLGMLAFGKSEGTTKPKEPTQTPPSA
ncbi:MAG: DUF5684 domain-containing protein [Candidatus Pacebacteria bacterium]|nr:DUF5684 domain-containing protein [Candidatus Paceibacterota bacterium]